MNVRGKSTKTGSTMCEVLIAMYDMDCVLQENDSLSFMNSENSVLVSVKISLALENFKAL
jgi:hypothetical protein